MVTEILLRCYTHKFVSFQKKLAALIENNTNIKVSVINHCDLDTLDVDRSRFCVVSLDKFIAERFHLPYVRISRLFNEDGTVNSHKILLPSTIRTTTTPIQIVDTDIVNGTTMDIASNLLKPIKAHALINVQDHQDLVDVEDLLLDNSLLVDGETPCSYMINEHFFAKRTNLPIQLYPKVQQLIQKFMYKTNNEIDSLY